MTVPEGSERFVVRDATTLAMVRRAGPRLSLESFTPGLPAAGEVLVRVEACGVCRTDLHVVDDELPGIVSPVIPGHEIVGRVVQAGPGVDWPLPGTRVGIAWLAGTCQACDYCRSGRENLCDAAEFTGYTRPGGFATHVVARADYCIALPPDRDPVALAPLLCAGLIGWRALRRAGTARRLGLYGFGASAHIVAQIARYEGREVYAFTRDGDTAGQAFARSLGVTWAGSSLEDAPVMLDAAIVFAADGTLVPQALRQLAKGGVVICAGIHMSPIPGFAYHWLWQERSIVSIANLTREDAHAFFASPACAAVTTTTTTYALSRANEALADLRAGRIHGAAVLVPEGVPE